MGQDEGQLTKQEILDEVSRLLEGRMFQVAAGATEPREFFEFVIEKMNIGVHPGVSKPELARLITGATGGSWDRTCDSTATPSGGGGTVTTEGLRRVLESVRRFAADRSLTTGDFTVDVRPDASALRIFRNISYTAWYALGEFVDNSITSAIQNHELLLAANGRDYLLRVEIEVDDAKQAVVVRDNAAGITRENIASAVRAGSLPIDTDRGLSIHGVGMKAAAFWWGSKLTIETFPVSSSVGWRVVIDLDEIDERLKGDVDVKEIEHRGVAGTVIKIENLYDGTPQAKTINTIRKYLPSIYRTFVGRHDSGETSSTRVSKDASYPVEILYQGEPLSFARPTLLKSPEWTTDKHAPPAGSPDVYWYQDVDFTVEVGRTPKRVSGWVGLLQVMSREMAGFFLHFRGKGVAGVVPVRNEDDEFEDKVYKGAYKPRVLFGQAGQYLDQRLTGELDISDFGKTLTTDDVGWTAEEEAFVLEKLKDLLTQPGMNFLRHGRSFRKNKQHLTEKRNSEQIVDAITETIAAGIKSSGLHHGPAMSPRNAAQESTDPPTFDTLDESQMSVVEKVIADDEHDDHHFRLEIISDLSKPFLEVRESDSERKHTIRINKLHPAFSSLPPIVDSLERLLATIGIALGVAEVFLSHYEKAQLRHKLNEVLTLMVTDE